MGAGKKREKEGPGGQARAFFSVSKEVVEPQHLLEPHQGGGGRKCGLCEVMSP